MDRELREMLRALQIAGRYSVPSSRRGKPPYEVIHYSNNTLSCPCTGWCNKKPGLPRYCRHTEKIGRELTARGIKIEPFPH